MQDDPNRYILTNTSLGSYDSFKWIYEDQEVENETEHIAYFPYAGTYEVELLVIKNSTEYSETKNLVISQDDPNINFQLVWSEEFNYTGLPESATWNMETGGGGWGNNELQYYTNTENNAYVDNGMLTITAREESYGGRDYTSARITTQNKYDFKYGKIEAKIKLPYGQGLWPAFWMLGANFNTVGWPNVVKLILWKWLVEQVAIKPVIQPCTGMIMVIQATEKVTRFLRVNWQISFMCSQLNGMIS